MKQCTENVGAFLLHCYGKGIACLEWVFGISGRGSSYAGVQVAQPANRHPEARAAAYLLAEL